LAWHERGEFLQRTVESEASTTASASKSGCEWL